MDKDRFQPIVPAAAAATTAAASSASAATQRVLNTEINFPDFTYKSEYLEEAVADAVKCTMCHRETFVDKTTQNVRQNEKTLYMEPIEYTLQKILSAGFTAKGFLLWKTDLLEINIKKYIFLKEFDIHTIC